LISQELKFSTEREGDFALKVFQIESRFVQEQEDEIQLLSRVELISADSKPESVRDKLSEGTTARIIIPGPHDGFKPLKIPNQIGDLVASSSFSNPENVSKEYLKKFKRGIINILLETKIENKNVGPLYNFSKTFIGSSYILFPFRCFVHAVSKLPHLRLRARLFHLIQSSGMGKTRLCFELLKELKSGIYCVYRSNGSTGYPSTRSWLEELIEAFKLSRSNEHSVYLCLQFIEQAIMKYKSLDEQTICSDFEEDFDSDPPFKLSFLNFNDVFCQWEINSR